MKQAGARGWGEPGRRLASTRSPARATLTEQAYEHLRSAISAGQIPAGEALSYSDISEVLAMSRTPVREAVNRLELEGYLHRDELNRLTVQVPDRTQVTETFWLREIIEEHAVALAARRISDAELSTLDELLEADRRALDSKRVDLLAETNDAIHDLILGAARNRALVSLVQGLRAKLQGLGAFAVGSFGDQAGFVHQHEEILAALREGDSATAVELTRSHLRRARDLLLAQLGADPACPEQPALRELPDPEKLADLAIAAGIRLRGP